MRYISTRGQAPVLPFAEAMMTGLARDGGLYVPAVWPMFSRDDILNRLRGQEAELLTRAVDILVSRLRRKLEGSALEIGTVRGTGYVARVRDGG